MALDTLSNRKRPGPKPGDRHPGQFKKGHDPRRNLDGFSPPQVKRDFQARVVEMGAQALEVLEECMGDDSAGWRERRSAAELVLAHSLGLPVNRIALAEVQGIGGGDPATYSLPDLRAWAAKQQQNEQDIPGEYVETTDV